MSNDPFADQPVDPVHPAEPAINWGDGRTPSPASQPASVGKRVGAYIIDSIGIMIVLGIVFAVVGLSSGAVVDPENIQGGVTGGRYVSSIVSSALVLAYFVLMEAGSGQTVAKRVLRIKVEMADGSPMTLAAAFRRRVLFFIGAIIPIFGGLISFAVPLAALVTAIQDEPRHQGFHDRLAHTRVIEV